MAISASGCYSTWWQLHPGPASVESGEKKMLSKLEPQGCGGLKPSGCRLGPILWGWGLGGWVFHPNDGEIHQVTSMFLWFLGTVFDVII